MRRRFAASSLASWTLIDFQEAFYDVHALEMHSGQVRNEV
jgi:hypothetical protein